MTAAEQPLIAIGSVNSKHRPDIPDEAEPKEKKCCVGCRENSSLNIYCSDEGAKLNTPEIILSYS
jgi:hypothetical protein